MKITSVIFLLDFLCVFGLCSQNAHGNSNYLSMDTAETSYPYPYTYSRYLHNYYSRYPYAYNNPYNRYPYNTVYSGYNRGRVHSRGNYRPYSSDFSGILGIFGGLGFGAINGYGNGFGNGFGGNSVINQHQNNYHGNNYYDDHSTHFFDGGDESLGTNSESNSETHDDGISNNESENVANDNDAVGDSGDVGDLGGDTDAGGEVDSGE